MSFLRIFFYSDMMELEFLVICHKTSDVFDIVTDSSFKKALVFDVIKQNLAIVLYLYSE